MDNIISIKADFEAQVTAALMIKSNALIPFKLAVRLRLCGITQAHRTRNISKTAKTLSHKKNSTRIAFYLKYIHDVDQKSAYVAYV